MTERKRDAEAMPAQCTSDREAVGPHALAGAAGDTAWRARAGPVCWQRVYCVRVRDGRHRLHDDGARVELSGDRAAASGLLGGTISACSGAAGE